MKGARLSLEVAETSHAKTRIIELKVTHARMRNKILGRGDYWGERGQSSADVNSTKNRQAESSAYEFCMFPIWKIMHLA